jgi:hypothetical protein
MTNFMEFRLFMRSSFLITAKQRQMTSKKSCRKKNGKSRTTPEENSREKSKIDKKNNLAPLHFCKNIKGSDTSESRQGRGDSGALRGTTRHWSFQGSGEGRRPFASLCGNHLVAHNKAGFPAGASAKRAAAPAPNPSSHPKNKDQK